MADRCLITGAHGFIGSALVHRLRQENREVRAAVRSANAAGVDSFVMGDLGAACDWSAALVGVAVIIHCAARVHVLREELSDPLLAFRKVNVDGTLNLARQAAEAGARRFIFISSVKVYGEGASGPYAVDDPTYPSDAYAISKFEAEQGLRELALATGMEVVIIRPPLVYGPGVKANFLSLMRWLHKGLPLPLGRIDNKRSFVALDNLIDLIMVCLTHSGAANQTFLVSDGEDLSTSEWLRRLGGAMGRPACLMPIPAGWLEGVAFLLGKQSVAKRLCGSLQVDISKTRTVLGWVPPVAIDDALHRTAAAFLARQAR